MISGGPDVSNGKSEKAKNPKRIEIGMGVKPRVNSRGRNRTGCDGGGGGGIWEWMREGDDAHPESFVWGYKNGCSLMRQLLVHETPRRLHLPDLLESLLLCRCVSGF